MVNDRGPRVVDRTVKEPPNGKRDMSLLRHSGDIVVPGPGIIRVHLYQTYVVFVYQRPTCVHTPLVH